MAAPNRDEIQADIDRKTWWLIGLSILIILGFSVTIPLLLLSLVRAGVLQGVLPPDGGASLVIGLLAMAAIFSLNLVYQQAQINKIRRRSVQDQVDLEQSRSRLAELTSLFQLGNSLHLDLPLETILEITVRRVSSTLHAHEADLFLLSRETRSLHCKASYGLSRHAPETEVPYGEGPVGSCARTREALLLVAGEKGVKFPEYFAARTDVGSVLLAPLRVEKRCVGVLRVVRTSSAEPFREEHRDLAQLFADNVGPVIERTLAAAALRQNTAATAAAPPPLEASAAGGSFQDAFVTSAAQELKSPLASIVAYSEVLDQNDRRLTPAMRAEFSARVRGEAQRMMGLVDDVLDVVRLELGRYVLELRVGNVNDVVKNAVESVRAAAAGRQVAVELALDSKIPNQHLDPAKLRQAVAHLVGNGVRFTPARGTVRVETILGDGEVRVEIRDGGRTSDAATSDDLFELDSMTRAEGKRAKQGLGFGLHLTKRFVELHGGTVGVEPAEQGALFRIRLPWGGDLTPLIGEDPFVEELARL